MKPKGALADAEAERVQPGKANFSGRLRARIDGLAVPKPVVGLATVAAWALAIVSWVGLCRATSNGKGLGFDLLITWRSLKLFAHGGAPYSIRGFVYPPSCLLLLRPLAALSHHQLVISGLIATAVIAWVTVALASLTVGRRWWGLTSAVTLFLLHYTEAMRGELSLENLTILGTLAVTLCCLLALRGHWLAAGMVVGLSLAFKPLLLVVLLLFVLAREWKALAAAIVIPAVLNGVAFFLVANPDQVFSKLPAVLNRVGPGVALNSAWVDVVRVFGWPDAVSVLLRLVTVAVVLLGAWLAWTRVADDAVRIITTTTVLLIGSYLAGTLSEYHFMLTLVPMAMTIVIARSPMRTVTAVVGIIWSMGLFVLPASWLGIAHDADHSAFRAFGMSLLLLSVLWVLARRRPLRGWRVVAPAVPVHEAPMVEVAESEPL